MKNEHLLQFVTFSGVYSEVEDFEEGLTKVLPHLKTREFFEDINYIAPWKEIIELIYNVFKAKTYGKYFIWNYAVTELGVEFLDCVHGLFFPLLFNEIVNFYKKQIVLLGNDLNELKDWKNRGNIYSGSNQTGQTKNSQPTDKGIEWNNDKDAPTLKQKSLNDNQWNNRINDMKKIIETNLNFYFVDTFTKFEKFFISKPWVDKYILNK